MEVYEARLESFGVSKAGKKRVSIAKGERPIWPHSDPSPEKLATAGFYWDPNDASTDRVTCCLCQTVLDGWEPADDPIKEHHNYSPQCGIAIHAQIEQNMENSVPVEEDPTSEAMVLARKATFRDLWPHEKKRGWVCKTQKVAEAGWYYCPTSESDDFVKCAYCGLSLDGWEPKDKPLDEHQRRSENCIFFTFSKPAKPKNGRAKKSRASKASRLSSQSTATTLDDTGMVDESIDEGDTVLTTATDMTHSSTASKVKKGGRAKKGKAKGKAAPAPAVESAPASSVLEPEDDDFEVKVASPPKRPTRAKKRKSEEIEEDGDHASEAPAAKRQATRARSSTVKPEGIDESIAQGSIDISMTDAGEGPAKSPPKKGGKRTARSRAASTRKASTRKASKAAKAAPAAEDEELDAALEADLDRSLVKDEATNPAKPATKSRTASRAQAKKAAAAAAPLETEVLAAEPARATRESTVGMETFQTANEGPSSIFNADESLPQIKNPKQRGAKKAKKVEEAPVTTAEDLIDIDVEVETTAATPTRVSLEPVVQEEATKPKGRQPSRKASRPISRQTSRQTSRQKVQAQQPEPGPEPVSEPVAEPSIRIEVPEIVSAEVTMIHDPVVIEQQESAEKPKRGKKAGTATKKGKKAPAAENIDEKTPEAIQVAPIEAVMQPVATSEVEEPSIPEPAKTKATKGRQVGKKTATVNVPEEEPAVDTFDPAEVAPPPETAKVVKPVREASATPVKSKVASNQQIPSPTPSPQSSDAENHPPSSRPSATRPPLVPLSPVPVRQALAVSTPTAARVKLNPSKLATTFAWTAVDLDYALSGTPGASQQENMDLSRFAKAGLTSPEKSMTVEEWIRHQATLGQERLRAECERTVQKFENEGVRALKALEGIVTEEQ